MVRAYRELATTSFDWTKSDGLRYTQDYEATQRTVNKIEKNRRRAGTSASRLLPEKPQENPIKARETAGEHGSGHHPEPSQIVRPRRRHPRRGHRHIGRRVHGPCRAVRLREIHAASYDCRARKRDRGHDPDRRARREQPAPGRARHRHGVSELRALSAQNSRRQPGLRPEAAEDRPRDGEKTGAGGGGDPWPHTLSGSLSASVIGRPASAGRHGPGHRARPPGVPL